MWKFGFENKISLLRRGRIKCIKKYVRFSIAFGCRRVNFYCHFTVSKCVILLYYVQKLGNQFNNKLTAIYVLLYDIQRKYLGSLSLAGPVLHMTSDLQANIFIPNVIKSCKFASVTVYKQ